MQYRISHTTKYAYSEPVPVCHNKVHLAPRSLLHQTVKGYRLAIAPRPVEVTTRTDYFGNQVDYFSIEVAHRALQVTSVSSVETGEVQLPEASQSAPWEEVARNLKENREPPYLEANQYTFDSVYARRMASLVDYTRQSFSQKAPALKGCLDLTRRIFEDYEYDPKATTVSAPVTEVMEKKAGVCQDFAHLQISCLRSIGLAARYVSGYLRTLPPPGKPRLVGADMSHAWVSVFCGSLGWIDFDPTNSCIPTSDHVTLAWGRDYSDVCPIQGVFIGGGQNSMTISVDVAPLDGSSPPTATNG